MPITKPMKMPKRRNLSDAVDKIFESLSGDPNETPDRNGVVGSGTVAYALNRIADAIFLQVQTQDGLHRIADAVNNLASAVREMRTTVGGVEGHVANPVS